MDIGFVFWLIMLIWILFWGFGTFGGPQGAGYWTRGSWLPLFVLLFLLGWRVFGFIIRGTM
jgi:hypothetical protein